MAPTNLKASNPEQVRALRTQYCNVILRLMDEHSMSGRAMWAWLRHRSEEMRRPTDILDDDGEVIFQEASSLPPDLFRRTWGGFPFLYSLGDNAQLPPVFQKPLYSTESARSNTADNVGRVVVTDYLTLEDTPDVKSTVVVMDKVLRQEDASFLALLDRMSQGELNSSDGDYILSKCLTRMSFEVQNTFKQAIHLVPIWKMAHPIVRAYLQHQLTTPIAKIIAQYHSVRSKNCCYESSSLPKRLAICVGAIVMLLQNFIVEYKLMNGSVCVVKEIVYKSKEGPSNKEEQPAYIIVDFKDAIIPGADALITGMTSTCVPIPVVTVRCEKNCCSVTTIPLRVCIAISIHKSQGMSIGPNEIFEKVVVYLPEGGNNTAGLELVAFSRAKNPNCLAVGNQPENLTMMDIQKIGKSEKNKLRRDFQDRLYGLAEISQRKTRNAILNLDSTAGEKSFEGGCTFLLNWFNTKIT